MLGSARLACLVLALASACGGYKQSNAVDLPAKDGIPVKIVDVRMHEMLSAASGTASGGTAPNTRGVSYAIEITGKPEPYAGTSTLVVCRAGDRTVAGNFSYDANPAFENAEIGTRLTGDESFVPSVFVEAIPSTCEARIYYTIAPPLPATPDGAGGGYRSQLVGAVCFVDDQLHARACTDTELPRTPAANDLEITELRGQTIVEQGTHRLAVHALATLGASPPRQAALLAKATCAAADRMHEVTLSLVFVNDNVAPGEAVVSSGYMAAKDAMSTAPTSCTIDVSTKAGEGERRSLGTWCLRDGATTLGGC